MSVLEYILSAKVKSRKLFVLLIDPEKQSSLQAVLPYLSLPDLIFVGGSTGAQTDSSISLLRQFTERPILLFPGNIAQFSPKADALLFLTLLNARTPEVLIDPHIRVAQAVMQSGIETIPMGYVLVAAHFCAILILLTNKAVQPSVYRLISAPRTGFVGGCPHYSLANLVCQSRFFRFDLVHKVSMY